jgi:hypothetical protein
LGLLLLLAFCKVLLHSSCRSWCCSYLCKSLVWLLLPPCSVAPHGTLHLLLLCCCCQCCVGERHMLLLLLLTHSMHQPSALALKMSSLVRFCSSTKNSSSNTRRSRQNEQLRAVPMNPRWLQHIHSAFKDSMTVIVM